MNNHYQLAVIGAGSGGREAALAAAQNGLRVVLIEKETLGGTCLHRGFYCLKALRACAEAAKDRSKSSKSGFGAPEAETRLPDWMTTQRKVSSRLTQALEQATRASWGQDTIRPSYSHRTWQDWTGDKPWRTGIHGGRLYHPGHRLAPGI